MIIELPLILLFTAGLLCLLLPSRYHRAIKAVALLSTLFAFAASIGFLLRPPATATGLFPFAPFPAFIGLGCAFFGLMTTLYSFRYADDIEAQNAYYAYIIWSVCFALATVFSGNLIVLLVCWGISGLMLYLLANLVPGASTTAKKAFVFIGGSDALMILGVALLWRMTGSFQIDRIRVALDSPSLLPMAAFVLLAAAALAKAGAMPLHSWIPDFADDVPFSMSALLPASLDKLLGVFLLFLLCYKLFVLNAVMQVLLLAIGAVTVSASMYMALIQRDVRGLLAYSAIAQIGYIILGLASGTVVGIVGGIFHMLNHALYKSGLFFSGGAVEYRAGNTNLDRLGGIARFMPVTFVCCLIFALSVAGVPPFNGFVSKWMIYQGLLQQAAVPGYGAAVRLGFILCLVLAMFGSALTLANSMKLVHAVFLGRAPYDDAKMRTSFREAPLTMLLPMALQALLCIVFGVFAYRTALGTLVLPALGLDGLDPASLPALWRPDIASALIVIGLVIGLLVYLGLRTNVRVDRAFIGGEELPASERVTGTAFYNTVRDIGFFGTAYAMAEKKIFDVYTSGTRAVLSVGSLLSRLHGGNLQVYLLWVLAGFLVLFFILVRIA
jgi:formate hydrogenlyase subunit 3/multisubunit Na+/H+ antiporter MnhD subunit